jgi:pimeloyl-ACP methyl ester carboxylesterase
MSLSDLASIAFATSLLVSGICGSSEARSSPADTVVTPSSEHHALVFGQRIHYAEAGTGPLIVLVHGLGDDIGVWQQELAPLALHYHVVAIDQIGFGRSDKPQLDYRAETFVDFLQEFMRTLHLRHATVVGNSLGGWVAALLAVEHPECVARLVLVDSAGLSALRTYLGPKLLKALRLSTIDDLRVLMPLTFARAGHNQSEKELRSAFAETVGTGDGYAVSRVVDSIERGEDTLDDRLGKIGQPTLIVWGRQDRLIPSQFGEALRRGIAGSRLVLLNDCGHEPQIECPQAFETVLRAFLTQPAR